MPMEVLSFSRCLYSPCLPCACRFTPDFTSSWVIRDLTLVTARGSSFPFTLNVTLPHHMLPLCAQVVPGPSWEESFWVVTLVFTWSAPSLIPDTAVRPALSGCHSLL